MYRLPARSTAAGNSRRMALQPVNEPPADRLRPIMGERQAGETVPPNRSG